MTNEGRNVRNNDDREKFLQLNFFSRYSSPFYASSKTTIKYKENKFLMCFSIILILTQLFSKKQIYRCDIWGSDASLDAKNWCHMRHLKSNHVFIKWCIQLDTILVHTTYPTLKFQPLILPKLPANNKIYNYCKNK